MAIKRLNEDTALKFQRLSPEEKKARGILGRLYGPVATFAAPTRNGRLYSQELWEKLFNSDLIKERFASGGIFGQLCHPDYEEVDMEKIACVMHEPPVKDKDGQLIGYVDILDTPCGRIAYQLAKYGYQLGISSRGSGDLITGYDGEETVDPDTYSLTAFDLVEIPAVPTARLTFVEGLNTKKYNKTLRQTLTETLNQASDEDRKLMQESLDDLGITLNEDKEDVDQKKDAWEKLQKANPDVKLDRLVQEYDGNLGNIMYTPDGFNKFKQWLDTEHAIKLNPIPAEKEEEEPADAGIELEEPIEEPTDADMSEPIDMSSDMSEPVDAGMDMGDDDVSVPIDIDTNMGEELEGLATQSVDMGQVDQASLDLNSEGKQLIVEEDEEEVSDDDSFYLNKTPYGFTEIVYKGRVITIGDSFGNDEQVTIEVNGDDWVMDGDKVSDKLDQAVSEVDELDLDPEYHIDPWHDPSDLQLASLDAVKKELGLNESMFIKKGDNFKKVAESKKPEQINENEENNSMVTELEQSLDNLYDGNIDAALTNVRTVIDALQSLDTPEGGDLDTEKEVGDTESQDGAVAELQEALKKARKLNRDNLSLQEKLSASNARETQLEEELARYKKALSALSHPASESRSLKESLEVKDKESKQLTEKLNSATSKAKRTSEENKKLTEQVEQLTARIDVSAQQLTESKELVEKYRRSYKSLKENYVRSEAQLYGLNPTEVQKVLGESYKVSDVDKTLRKLGTTNRNMNKLPIELNESARLSTANMKVKSTEKIRTVDDTSLDHLKSLLD